MLLGHERNEYQERLEQPQRVPIFFLPPPSLGNLVKIHARPSSQPYQSHARAAAVPHEHSVPSEEMHPDQNGI